MQFHPETCHKTIQSPWGSLTLAANPKGLSGVWFENQKHFPDTHAWTLSKQHPTLLQAEQSLRNYYDQKWPPASPARKALQNIALDLSAGTEFQKSRLACPDEHSHGANMQLWSTRSSHRSPHGGQGRRHSCRPQPHQHPDSLPPRDGQSGSNHRLCRRYLAQTSFVEA